MTRLLERLFGTDPYEGFPSWEYPLHYATAFNLPKQALGLINNVAPSRIIEVGTWLGNSAFFMADAMKAMGRPFEMICVDTWLGSLEAWPPAPDSPDWSTTMRRQYGHPTTYHHFLANVIHKGYRDAIIPLPTTSDIGFRLLRRFGYTAQFIYIDASHDEEDVTRDMNNYWQLLEVGGIMCGDDYDERFWPGVVNAVKNFSARTSGGMNVLYHDHSWWVCKCDTESSQ